MFGGTASFVANLITRCIVGGEAGIAEVLLDQDWDGLVLCREHSSLP